MKKILLITGAGSGIGRAAAQALGAPETVLILCGRRREPLEETARLARIEGADARIHPLDVTDENAVDSLFDHIATEHGRLDLLFNNAGISAPGVPLEELELAQWNDVVNVNLTGMFICLRAAFRIMKNQTPQGGRIINNGSISAHTPRPNSIAYTATKHAVTGLTKSAALDGRRYDIACGQIDIGNAVTAMTEAMPKGVLQADGSLSPEARMNPEDVGAALRYMASLPLSANVLTMTIMATKMPFVGRG